MANSTVVPTLDQYAEEIRAALDGAESSYNDALAYALDAGDTLILAKEQCHHGSWQKWLGDEFEMSDRTARRYMALAAKRTHVADLGSVRAAVGYLTEHADSTTKEAAEEAQERAVSAQKQVRAVAQQEKIVQQNIKNEEEMIADAKESKDKARLKAHETAKVAAEKEADEAKAARKEAEARALEAQASAKEAREKVQKRTARKPEPKKAPKLIETKRPKYCEQIEKLLNTALHAGGDSFEAKVAYEKAYDLIQDHNAFVQVTVKK